MSKGKVIIVGTVDVGKTALIAERIAEMQLNNPDVTVVTADEAKSMGLTETFDITAEEIHLPERDFIPPETRAERRKRKRKKK